MSYQKKPLLAPALPTLLLVWHWPLAGLHEKKIIDTDSVVDIGFYPMIKKSSQSEATIPMNCDPIYPLHGAILNRYTTRVSWTMTYIQWEQLISHEAEGRMGYELLSLDIWHSPRHPSGIPNNTLGTTTTESQQISHFVDYIRAYFKVLSRDNPWFLTCH